MSLTGERLGKEYRDRYANFSKGAHFVFGSQGKKSNKVEFYLYHPLYVHFLSKNEGFFVL